jgi:hypothetical protein
VHVHARLLAARSYSEESRDGNLVDCFAVKWSKHAVLIDCVRAESCGVLEGGYQLRQGMSHVVVDGNDAHAEGEWSRGRVGRADLLPVVRGRGR